MNRYDYLDTDSYTDNFKSCMKGGIHKVKPPKNPYYNIKRIKPNKVLKFKIKERDSGRYGRNKRGKR